MKNKNAHADKVPTTSLTFPLLHSRVLEAVGEDTCPAWASNAKQRSQYTKEHLTHVSGHFRCSNRTCGKAWSSGLVAIRIRAFRDDRYSATVYNQRCKVCNALGFLKLDEDSYVERIAYRLKKWAGVPVEVPHYEKKSTPPHRRELCEGCKQGCCQEGERDFITRDLQRMSLY